MTTEQATPMTDAFDMRYKTEGEWRMFSYRMERDFNAKLSTSQSTVEQLQGRMARLHETLLAMHKFTFEERWGAKGFDDGAQRMFNRSLNALDPAGSIEDWLQGRLREERERCAKVCERIILDMPGHGQTAQTKPVAYPQPLYAAAIRALPEEG